MAREVPLSWVVVGLSVCLITIGYAAGRMSMGARSDSRGGARRGIAENIWADSLEPFAARRPIARRSQTNRYVPHRGRFLARGVASADGWRRERNIDDGWPLDALDLRIAAFDEDAFNVLPLPSSNAESPVGVVVDPSRGGRIVFDTSPSWLRRPTAAFVDPRTKRQQLKSLIFGLEHYRGMKPALGAKADADALSNVLMSEQSWGLRDVQPIYEVDGSRFVSTVRSFFTTEAHEGDILFFYFAGHGAVGPSAEGGEEGYLLPNDFTAQFDANHALSATGLWQYVRIAVEERHVEKVVIIVDACHSGAMQNLPFPSFEALEQKVVVIASSGAKENSYSCKSGSDFSQTIAKSMTDPGSIDPRFGAVTMESSVMRALSKVNGREMPAADDYSGEGAATLEMGWPHAEAAVTEGVGGLFGAVGYEPGPMVVATAEIWPLHPRTYSAQLCGRDPVPSNPVNHSVKLIFAFSFEKEVSFAHRAEVKFMRQDPRTGTWYPKGYTCTPDNSTPRTPVWSAKYLTRPDRRKLEPVTCEFEIPSDWSWPNPPTVDLYVGPTAQQYTSVHSVDIALLQK